MKLTNHEYKELIGELEMYKQERDELIDAINEALDYLILNYTLISRLDYIKQARKILLKAIGAE